MDNPTIENQRERTPHEHALHIIGQLIHQTGSIQARIRRGENITNTEEYEQFQTTYFETLIHTANAVPHNKEDYLLPVNEPIKAIIQAIKYVNKLKEAGFYRVDHKPILMI